MRLFVVDLEKPFSIESACSVSDVGKVDVEDQNQDIGTTTEVLSEELGLELKINRTIMAEGKMETSYTAVNRSDETVSLSLDFSNSSNVEIVGGGGRLFISTLLMPKDAMKVCTIRPHDPVDWQIQMLPSFKTFLIIEPVNIPIEDEVQLDCEIQLKRATS